jgi:hypothetical protein
MDYFTKYAALLSGRILLLRPLLCYVQILWGAAVQCSTGAGYKLLSQSNGPSYGIVCLRVLPFNENSRRNILHLGAATSGPLISHLLTTADKSRWVECTFKAMSVSNMSKGYTNFSRNENPRRSQLSHCLSTASLRLKITIHIYGKCS